MMLCPWDIICHGLSLCIAMWPTSCFITPHLLTASAGAFAEASETNHHGYCLSDVTLPGKESEKLCREAKPLAPAANAAGNFLWCPPLPIYCNQHWVSGWGVTAGLVITHPWPLHEWLTKRQQPFLWILRKGHKLGGRLLNMRKHFRLSHFSAGCRQRSLLRRIVIRVPALSGHSPRHFWQKEL